MSKVNDVNNESLFDDAEIGEAIDLPVAALRGGQLRFADANGRARAYELGAFRLRYPAEFDPEPGRRLALNFHEDGENAGLSNGYSGYRAKEGLCFLRSAYRMEQLIIGRDDRLAHFPAEAQDMARQMDDLSTTILRDILRYAHIDEKSWDFLTGNAASNSGTHWFVANNYRPCGGYWSGCSAHQDTGFVTVLYIETAGLEGLVADKWRPIDPEPGYFVVNFGLALEVLTRQSTSPVVALMHRVRLDPARNVSEPRISFAAFSSAPTHGKLYELDTTGAPSELYDVDEFLREHDQRTWRDDA
jgi:hypothetical protein